MFFATPHLGGQEALVGLGRTLAKIVNTVAMSPSNDLLDAVRSGTVFSDILREQWKEQMTDYRVYSYHEGEGQVRWSDSMMLCLDTLPGCYVLINPQIVTRDSATLGLGNAIETVAKLQGTHSNICRLDKDSTDPGDMDNWEVVIHHLKALYRLALPDGEASI